MSRMQRMAVVGLCFLSSVTTSFGQNQAPPRTVDVAPPIAATPAANPADVASPDAIIAAAYDVISGPAVKNGIGIACFRFSILMRG
jgi:hypothetical protein